jgi:folate-binding protein YgfZ
VKAGAQAASGLVAVPYNHDVAVLPDVGALAAGYRAAREALAHRVRESSVVDVEGPDRVAFLQGQLTQDVRSLAPGESRPAAALTPKGKLLFFARLLGMPDRLRLIVPARSGQSAVEHLKRFVIFQKVEIADRSAEFVLVGLFGPRASQIPVPEEAAALPADGEFAREILVPRARFEELGRLLESAGSVGVSEATAEILRVEAGRPRLGQDADTSNLADEVGLDTAISTTKGCYVGQEIVARMRTYGRVNRRLAGFWFPEGLIEPGTVLKRPEEPEAGKVEQGRVTSAVLSPAFGPIGLGYAFRDVAIGERLVSAAEPSLAGVVAPLPFSP